jgi:hypothetical protein
MKFKKNQVLEYKGGDYFVDRTAHELTGIPAFIKKKECCIFLKTLEDDNDLALVSVFKINEKGDAVGHRFSIRMDCLRVYHSNSKDFQIGDLLWYDGKDKDSGNLRVGYYQYLGESTFEGCGIVSNNGSYRHILKENLHFTEYEKD